MLNTISCAEVQWRHQDICVLNTIFLHISTSETGGHPFAEHDFSLSVV